MLSRTRVAAVALAVVSSAVLIGGIAEASSPGLTAPETMVVTVRGGTSSFINNAGSPNGFDPGDMLILTQPAYRGTGTTRIGTGFVTLVATGADSAQLHASLKLNGGDIELGGIQPPADGPFTLAVTGGTGAFQNARGQAMVNVAQGNANPAPARITLTLLP